MAEYTSKKYEFQGLANVGESITLGINSATPFDETVPSWATKASISLVVRFYK